MQTKRTIAVVLAGAGLTGALSLGGATSAGAVNTDEPQQPAKPAKVGAQGMTFYDDYWTHGDCMAAGQWGADAGKWTIWYCQASPWDYDLYYDS